MFKHGLLYYIYRYIIYKYTYIEVRGSNYIGCKNHLTFPRYVKNNFFCPNDTKQEGICLVIFHR